MNQKIPIFYWFYKNPTFKYCSFGENTRQNVRKGQKLKIHLEYWFHFELIFLSMRNMEVWKLEMGLYVTIGWEMAVQNLKIYNRGWWRHLELPLFWNFEKKLLLRYFYFLFTIVMRKYWFRARKIQNFYWSSGRIRTFYR
jgi:hypothetical protein